MKCGVGWAAEEFAEVRLGDKRLDARLVKLCDRFSDAPESPINQACADWAETKAAVGGALGSFARLVKTSWALSSRPMTLETMLPRLAGTVTAEEGDRRV